jgi:hypothetical protein
MSSAALLALAAVLLGLGIMLAAFRKGYDTAYMRKPWSHFTMVRIIKIGAALFVVGFLGLAAWLAGPYPK